MNFKVSMLSEDGDIILSKIHPTQSCDLTLFIFWYIVVKDPFPSLNLVLNLKKIGYWLLFVFCLDCTHYVEVSGSL